jgi:hypothetical protein
MQVVRGGLVPDDAGASSEWCTTFHPDGAVDWLPCGMT